MPLCYHPCRGPGQASALIVMLQTCKLVPAYHVTYQLHVGLTGLSTTALHQSCRSRHHPTLFANCCCCCCYCTEKTGRHVGRVVGQLHGLDVVDHTQCHPPIFLSRPSRIAQRLIAVLKARCQWKTGKSNCGANTCPAPPFLLPTWFSSLHKNWRTFLQYLRDDIAEFFR